MLKPSIQHLLTWYLKENLCEIAYFYSMLWECNLSKGFCYHFSKLSISKKLSWLCQEFYFYDRIRSCRERFSFLYKFNKFLKEYVRSLCFRFMIKKSCEIFVLCLVDLNFISVQYLSSFLVNIEFVLLQIRWEILLLPSKCEIIFVTL